ncbi:DUF3565 domain-containing protein [Marinobacter fonticola]|uniref:DUF3565 domain-containing protein n=1 Tax=Marinobacter fonticola TaxID=2603215 RepID=UPI0011E85D65|nr:DUF3565 domain-containing protein [Marinobacter fonticola]
MEQSIVGFYKDAENNWVARLACGHGQHMRHRPPFVNRPWVTTASGRRKQLGTRLDCLKCDRCEPVD